MLLNIIYLYVFKNRFFEFIFYIIDKVVMLKWWYLFIVKLFIEKKNYKLVYVDFRCIVKLEVRLIFWEID